MRASGKVMRISIFNMLATRPTSPTCSSQWMHDRMERATIES